MGFGGFLQLFLTMAQRAFCQEVDGLSPTTMNPIDTQSAIHEAEHLYMFEFVDLFRIAADHAYSLFLAFRDACRSHLYTIHIKIVKQHAGDDEFLVRQKAYATGLFSIAQGGVENLYKRSQTLVFSYLFCCSHCVVLS